MAIHNELGKAGEEAAAAYLQEQGYVVLHRNWRLGRHELDIVARQDSTIVVVEVKTRSNTDFADPTEAITPQKIRHVVLGANAYLLHHQIDLPVRFDIITAIGMPGHFTIEHYPDAFESPIFS